MHETAARVTNLLLIAQAMGLDPTDPEQRGRALRQLELVEKEVERND